MIKCYNINSVIASNNMLILHYGDSVVVYNSDKDSVLLTQKNIVTINYINGLIDYYANFINQSVADDPQKIYTYNEFLNEVNSLKDYFSNRSEYLIHSYFTSI